MTTMTMKRSVDNNIDITPKTQSCCSYGMEGDEGDARQRLVQMKVLDRRGDNEDCQLLSDVRNDFVKINA
jgi:tRNA(Ile2) C34 agmatinyltransferase TiaS